MKAKQFDKKINVTSKKVDHPLAKYNSLNQVVCILCNNVLKNDLLWTAHLQSKQHKEKAVALKTQGPAKPIYLETTSGKRKADSKIDNNTEQKYRKSTSSLTVTAKDGLPSDFFDKEAESRERKQKAKAAFLAGYSSSEESEEESEDEGVKKEESLSKEKSIKIESSSSGNSKGHKGLPADFFDSGIEPSGIGDENQDKSEPVQDKKMSEVLPEGFFDDPKMDAKKRNVEYKDKMEEEWGLFQNAIKDEAKVSEIIMEEDDEQANIDRNIDEIDDQIQRWQEVENLHIKKEKISKNIKEEPKEGGSDDDLDDDDLDQFMEWREKKVMK